MVARDPTVIQSSVGIGDPHICSDSTNRNSLVYSIYETLVQRTGPGVFKPLLAIAWSIDPDGLTWNFQLRENVMFHNGDILSSKDVVASLNRIVDPAIGGAFGTQGVYASYLGEAEFKPVKHDSLRIVTAEPMADLLDLLAEMPIAPESEIDHLPREHIGTGPYQTGDVKRDEILLEGFRKHWMGKPVADEITWIAEQDVAERIDAVVSNDADIASQIGIDGKQEIESQNVRTAELKSGLCIIFMFNSGSGVCSDPHVRQALNYGLDLDSVIMEVKKGAATPLNGFLTPHHYGYDPETPVYPYDPSKAKQLLGEAGYRAGVKIVIDIPTAMPDEAPLLADMMKEQYEEIGVDVEIKSYRDRAAYAEMVRDKKIHDLCCFDSSPISTYRVLREKIYSGLKGPWWQGYSSKEVDNLIERAQKTFDNEAREQIYREIYRKITRDAPWVFLYRPTYYWGIGKRLPDWYPQSNGLIRF